jgi:peptide/nickel transport system ATP-binding protein
METILKISDLDISIGGRNAIRRAVKNVNLEIAAGEAVALVGESGSGKSLTAMSILGLLPEPAVRVSQGKIELLGRDLTRLDLARLREVRGREVGMIFQDPMTYLNPVFTIERQLGEILKYRKGMTRKARHERILELLTQVRIRNPEQIARSYPHQLSGGMRQRVLIAAALAGEPKLIVADEPTTALDVSVQASILDLIKELIDRLGIALLLITHDMGVVAGMCDRVYVMKEGEIVEQANVFDLFAAPKDPYTRKLLDSVLHHESDGSGTPPVPAHQSTTPQTRPLLSVRDIRKTYVSSSFLRNKITTEAVRGVSFDIAVGETLALVGESGCGKSTIGRIVMNLTPPTSGDVLLSGESVYGRHGAAARQLRQRMQIVFQDPFSSLNPRKTIRHILGQPLAIHRGGHPSDYSRQAAEMLDRVGLAPGNSFLDRLPHEFSGGQRQRIAIARALMLNPSFVVADEAVSSLDVSVRAQVLELLAELQRDLRLTYLFITHDLGVARTISQTAAVMHRGEIVEIGTVSQVFDNPSHDYTVRLIEAAPVADPVKARSRRLERTSETQQAKGN